MYRISVNKKSFELEPTNDGMLVDNELLDWDIQEVGENHFHIISGNKSYSAEVVDLDRVAKSFVIKINGRLYSVAVKDRFDLLLEKMGMTATAGARVNTIKAPMPGLIIELKVREGDAVKQGDTLVILEAMKMENIIKSPGEGTVKSVKVKKGDSVEKNQVLIEF